MSEPDLTTRMRAMRVDLAPDVVDRHIQAVLHELREPSVQPSHVPVRRGVRRRRLAGVLAMSLILLFPVAALAAEETVPGDTLYVVKQSTEWVRALVDDDVVGRHRARELEISIERGQPVEVVLARLDASLAAIDDADAVLLGRVEQARQRIRRQYGVDVPGIESPGQRERRGPAGPGSLENGSLENGSLENGSLESGLIEGSGTSSGSRDVDESPTTRDPVDSGSGDGAGDGSAGSTPARSTVGQPDHTPEPGSGNLP
jgi:hypothetical protein